MCGLPNFQQVGQFDRMWKRLASRLLDLVYPPVCGLCGIPLREGRALCGACAGDLPRIASPCCEVCGEMVEGRVDGEFSCPNCHGLDFAFRFARPALRRDERTMRLIHRMKYGREIHLAGELGRLALESFQDERWQPALEGRWPLVPVPLHRSRMRHRHFNQAAEIARIVSTDSGLSVVPALKRVRATETQTHLKRARRLENLQGAFALTRQGRIWAESMPEGAVLVDDVLTTGSTVHAAATVLRQAGVRQVVVLAVMRG